MEPMRRIAISALHKNWIFAQTLGKDFAIDIYQMNTLTNVATSVLDSRIAMDAWEKTKAEPVTSSRGVSEAVNNYVIEGRFKYLAHAIV